ncbi:unnamed protein product [Victoria cruziana]
MPEASSTAPTPPKPKSAPQKAMEKLGLVRDIDLALHLPLRYEDETRITPIAQAREGDTVQCEGVVTDCRIETRGRRVLLVRLEDESGAQLLLTPVYPTSASLPQAYLRKAVAAGLRRAELGELLPPGTVPRGLPPLREALDFLHHPTPRTSLATLEDHSHPAWQRLKFEELLAQQLSQLQAQRERARLRAPALRAQRGGLHEKLLAALPFGLTRAQQRVGEEIAQDLARPAPMHRLLQGDVGAGKTVVAALAAAVAIDAGWQCALMAPTEILAEQHFRKLVGWLEPLGLTVAWLTGSVKGKARQKMMDAVADGSAQLVIGTHAVIEDKVAFKQLGLAIIDEQHRFGVAQRLALRKKLAAQALEPHLLMMSATPIPRTLAMTYFADLDVSTIDELPPGRTPIVTKVYWVCPLIEESETLDLKNATETHAELADALAGRRVGLLHGRMPPAEKAAVMAEFSAGRMSVLVATTVIEVGVDVPNASLMVIEHAERFGLSQLHQLRGRVGRGAKASVCVLLYSGPLSPTGKDRLRAMAETNDGFEIARRDLDIRGPGEFMGARQSGAELLRFADLQEDAPLLKSARELAPLLLDQHPQAALQQVERWLGTKAEFLKA